MSALFLIFLIFLIRLICLVHRRHGRHGHEYSDVLAGRPRLGAIGFRAD
jgi:hypothetical protein